MPLPSLSVVPTRNRAAHAADCAPSILSGTGFDELVVVDQSDHRETETALAEIGDRRLRYVGGRAVSFFERQPARC